VIRPALVISVVALTTVARAEPVTEVHYVMGTYYRITAEGEDVVPALRGCFQHARRLEQVYSRFDDASELSRVNATAGAPRLVSDEFASLLRRSLALGAATGGAFDVTVGALTELWRDSETPPTPGAVAAARDRVGAARVRLDGRTLELPAGHRLDFDGIAKGWAVDGCVARLRAAGIRRALVSLGESSVYAVGAPAGEAAWPLEVRGVEPEEAVGVLRLRDEGLSVSAAFGGEGRRGRAAGYVVDPRTGAALAEPAVAAVVSASATDAEAWSKALLLWGARGVDRIEGLGARGAVHVGRRVSEGRAAQARRLFEAFPSPRPLTATVARP
jgi:thiamine biosynthesis lipoprotein